jgi:hypothetical protein
MSSFKLNNQNNVIMIVMDKDDMMHIVKEVVNTGTGFDFVKCHCEKAILLDLGEDTQAIGTFASFGKIHMGVDGENGWCRLCGKFLHTLFSKESS